MAAEIKLPPVPVRFTRFEGEIYLKQDDVVAFLLQLAATEETDVRDRIVQSAFNLGKKPA